MYGQSSNHRFIIKWPFFSNAKCFFKLPSYESCTLGVHNIFILHPNQELSSKSIVLGMRFQKKLIPS